MSEEKTKYSREELAEFEEMIQGKLKVAKAELNSLKKALSGADSEGIDNTTGVFKSLDDGADTAERESMNQLAARQSKYIQNLERAMVRINNGTYGICVVTGNLISKERLRAVPHTTESIAAKKARE